MPENARLVTRNTQHTHIVQTVEHSKGIRIEEGMSAESSSSSSDTTSANIEEIQCRCVCVIDELYQKQCVLLCANETIC